MKTQTQLRMCAYLLALLGLLSVTVTEHFSSVWPLAAILMVIAGWFYEGPKKYTGSYRRIWMALGVCALLFFPFDVFTSGRLLLPAVRISIFAQAYLLFNRKNIGTYRRMFVVSFAQLLAATDLTTGITFAVVLFAFCVTAIYGVMLMQLLRDLQMSGYVPEVSTFELRVPRRLLASSMICTVLLLILALGFFYAAPRLRFAVIARDSTASALDQIRRTRMRTGFTRVVQLGTFGRVQEDLTLALRVEVSPDYEAHGEHLRWRGGALNIYDGMVWTSSRDYFPYYNGRQWRIGSRNAGLIVPRGKDLYILDERYANYESPEQLDADPRLLKQVCYLEVPFSESLFGAGEMKVIQGSFRYGIGRDFNGSLLINNRQSLPELISYTVYSEIYEPDEAALRRVVRENIERPSEEESYVAYVRRHNLQLPTTLNPRIKQLAFDVTRNAETPYDKVNAIKKYLETEYSYSLDLTRPVTDDPLYDFLFVSRSGHCEYFASALALMTRVIGIPARLVKGFQKGEWNDAGGFYEVRQRDAHAWVEVFLPGHGWLTFDPSPRAAADEYFDRQRPMIARAFSKQLLLFQIKWRAYVIGYNQTRRMRLFAGVRDFLLHDGPRAVADFAQRLVNTVRGLNVLQWSVIATAAAGLFAAYFAHRKKVLLQHVSLFMSRSARARSGAVFYERMLALLEKRRIAKPAFMTPLEFLSVPLLHEHPMLSDIEALTSIYYRVRFRGETLGDDEAATIRDILRRLKQSNGGIRSRAKKS
jgi:hypothetical protein